MTALSQLLHLPSREEKKGSKQKLKVMLNEFILFMRKTKKNSRSCPSHEAGLSSGYHQLILGKGE